jgi:hypothetical protein
MSKWHCLLEGYLYWALGAEKFIIRVDLIDLAIWVDLMAKHEWLLHQIVSYNQGHRVDPWLRYGCQTRNNMDMTGLWWEFGQRNFAHLGRLKNSAIGCSNFNWHISFTSITNGCFNCEKVVSHWRISSDTVIRYIRGTIGVWQNVQIRIFTFTNIQWLPSISFGARVMFPNMIVATLLVFNYCIICVSMLFRLASMASVTRIES